MACAAWLRSPKIPLSLSPLLYSQCNLSISSFCRFNPASGFISFTNRFRSPASAVQVQAKRRFIQKEDEVASADDLCFEAPLKIVEYPDARLRAKNKRITTFDENLKKLVDEMFDVMYRTEGIGLSAPQVGINVQLMVFNPVGERGEGEEIVLVNPSVTSYSKKIVPFTEGCLSFPGIDADVMRPETVKVDAKDINGLRFSFSMSGLVSRVFQHEFDHLQGTLFIDRMTDGVCDSIRTDLEAFEKKYEETTGSPPPESITRRKTGKRVKAAVGFGKS